MQRRKVSVQDDIPSPDKMFLTVDEMSVISGIGQNFLRSLIERHEIDYVEIGAKKLLTRKAVLDWYERNKVHASTYKTEVA